MKIICFFQRLLCRQFAWLTIATGLVLAGPTPQIYAADAPASAPSDANTANPSVETPTPAPSAAITPTPTETPVPAAAPASSQNPSNSPTPTATSKVAVSHARLPLAFTDFAADYQPKELHPNWLTVQIGILETVFAPPSGKTMFVLPELQSELADFYQPVEISCLLGAKSRFENTTQIDIDPLGHPLGYTLPMGKIVYVLARAEQAQGISFSFYYYESSELRWLPSSEKDGSFMPITLATTVTRDLTVPADGYVFVYLSNRVGPSHPDSTARPVPLYTYLILHVHPVAQPAPALDTPAPATSAP